MLSGLVVVLALCLAAVHAVGQQVRAVDAAAHTARLVGRGDSAPALSHGQHRVIDYEGEYVCVTVRNSSLIGVFGVFGFESVARGCALNEEAGFE